MALLSSRFRLPLEIGCNEAVHHTALSLPHRTLNHGDHKHGYSILSEPCSEGRTVHVRGGTKPTVTFTKTLHILAGFSKQSAKQTTWAGRTSTQSSRASCTLEISMLQDRRGRYRSAIFLILSPFATTLSPLSSLKVELPFSEFL